MIEPKSIESNDLLLTKMIASMKTEVSAIAFNHSKNNNTHSEANASIIVVKYDGIARTLSYAHQTETTVSSNDSLQLHPFSKWELLLKERICSQSEGILSFKSSSLGMEIHLNHIR